MKSNVVSFVSMVVSIVVLLLALFVVCYYLVGAVRRLNDMQVDEIGEATDNAMEMVFERNGIVDCANTRLPCVSDRQCTDNCSIQNAIGTLVCYEGFCSSRDAALAGRPDDFDCDLALGLIKVYVASEFVVDQLCISTYRDVVDDFGDPRPYLCDAGRLDIDLANRQFSAADCTCASNYTKMLFDQTALARTVPVCIPNTVAKVYARVYEAA